MKSKLLPLILSALFFPPMLLFAGVLNENKLDRISMGMSAKKIISALGDPHTGLSPVSPKWEQFIPHTGLSPVSKSG